MSVETRIKAEFSDKRYTPDENGEDTEQVDIPGSGLTIDEVENHKWVEEAFINDDGSFHVYVSATDSGQEDFVYSA